MPLCFTIIIIITIVIIIILFYVLYFVIDIVFIETLDVFTFTFDSIKPF